MATTTPSVSSQPSTPPSAAVSNTAESSTSGTEASASLDPTERQVKVQSVIHRNVLWSLGVGLIPIPIVDFVGVTTVQLKMLRELAVLYNVKFSEQIAKKILASLLGGIGSAAIGGVLAASFSKFVPIIGTSLGSLSLPALSGAFTLATGRVFVAHFESGGTILDFNPKAIREHFRAEFEQAKQTVSQMKKDEPPRPTTASANPAMH